LLVITWFYSYLLIL